MPYKVDPSFKESGKRSRKRQTKRRFKRLAIGLGALTAVLAISFSGWHLLSTKDDTPEVATSTSPSEAEGDGENFAMVQMAESSESAIIAVRTPFLDLRKDPLILHFEQSGNETETFLSGPPQLPVERVGAPSPERLALLRDNLVVSETQLVTTIPSSREDLAYFQAQRSQGIAALTEEASPSAPATAGTVVTVDGDEGSWGELVGDADVGEDTATYVETKIENTTSVAFLLRESERHPLFQDHIVLLQTDRDIAEVLQSAGLDETSATQAATAAKRLLEQSGTLEAGSLVAMRVRPGFGGTALTQMSLYHNEAYFGTLTQIGAGRFDTGADPWAGEDLLARSEGVRPTGPAQQNVRLLDAIYSAAMRNGLSTTLVGELIVMMSQSYDLDRYAAEGDKVAILYAPTPGPQGNGSGQILYAGITGPSGQIDCYVVKDRSGEGFSCFKNRTTSQGLGAGLVLPVNGTRTSGFGPRMHPILRQVRNHNGVDWAAPTGTPVHAAADGKVTLAGNGGGYGNVIYIDHGGGRQTRYAHLNAFAQGISAGAPVKAGEVIGYVGTTGRSTGPHLHFEFWVNGTPVDPMGGGGVGTGTSGGAIEALVNRIITVESAGRADAANPNSTAVGLGQFIESTWLRMMRTYRPELVQTMNRGELLALRTNPEISREMVRNLARESEAFLRSRGHNVTAGRLYLAHFLGAEGADIALRADPSRSVAEVMGANVVRANGFLRGKTIADLRNWADRKMNSTSTVAVTVPATPEEKAYMDLIDTIIKESDSEIP